MDTLNIENLFNVKKLSLDLGILYGRLCVEDKIEKLEDGFRKLKTDQERIIFTLNVMLEYDLVPKTDGMPKCAKKSEELRKEGNRVFIRSDFNNIICLTALELYTRSIAFAPYPSVQLALSYANRSAALLQLGLHLECIRDIDRALALSYPDNLKAKLYIRKAECLMILKSSCVKDTLKEAQHWLEKRPLSDASQKKLRLKLEALQSKVVQTKQFVKDMSSVYTEAKKSKPPLPIIAYRSDEVLCASNAVAIKYNTCYGRHIVATRDIYPGEIISVEKPYSLLLLKDNMQTHCSNCLEVCWANIPCKYCTFAMYCSEECRDAEWEKCHNVECVPFLAMVEYCFHDCDFFSLRLAILSIKEAGGMEELRAMLKKLDEYKDPRTRNFSQDGKLHSDSFVSVYNLITNTDKRAVPDLLRRTFDTSFILYFLATRTMMFGAKLPEDLSVLVKNDDVTFFGGLILRYQQIVLSNVHTFTELQGTHSKERGAAATSFCSLINHSCCGNVLRQSRSNHIMIYATNFIGKGAQVFDNYGKHYATDSKLFRQVFLKEYFFFNCECVPCQENWPLHDDLRSFKKLVRKPKDKRKIEKVLRLMNAYYFYLKIEGDVKDKPYILQDLLKMVRILHKYVPMPCREMNDVVDMLEHVFHLNGNRFELPKLQIQRK